MERFQKFHVSENFTPIFSVLFYSLFTLLLRISAFLCAT